MFHIGRARATIAALCFGALAGCSDPFPDMTDEELVGVIGEVSHLREQLYLPKQVVECVRLLSGLDHAVYKDLAEPLLGAARTNCRLVLNQKLKDDKRNPKGVALAHFEDSAVGERVTRLFDRLEEQDRQRRQDDQIRRDAEKRAETEGRLSALRQEVEALSDDLDTRLNGAERDCAEWIALRDRMVDDNRHSIWRSRAQPELCDPAARAETREGLLKARSVLQDLKVEGDVLLFRFPALGAGDPKRVTARFAALAKDLDELRKDAAQ